MAASPAEVPYVEVMLRPGAAWVHARGDIDLAVVPALHAAMDEALESALPMWLNLSAVTFLDSNSVREVLHAQRRASARDTCFLIVPPAEPHVMLPFHLLDLTDELPLVNAPREASRRNHLRGLPSLYGRSPEAAMRQLPPPARRDVDSSSTVA